MPLTWKDWLKVTISAGGTGALTVSTASSGFVGFVAGDDGKLFPYSIQDGTAWETGYGTYTHSGTSFARTSRTASSTGSALTVSTSALLFVDLVSNIAQGMDAAAQAVIPGGRLTLTTALPVTVADVTAATTVYYTPFIHNGITLWDGNRWAATIFAEVSLALGTITSAQCYDVFGYLSSGALATELLAWTNATTRATAITLQDGRYCKSGDKTRLYLGTFYTTATTTTEDSKLKRFLFNMYNRVRRPFFMPEQSSAVTWTYSSATKRQWNNSASNRVQLVCGLAGAGLDLFFHHMADMQNAESAFGIGEDSATVVSANCAGRYGGYASVASETTIPGSSSLMVYPTLGFHYYQALEGSPSAISITIYGGTSSDNFQMGFRGAFEA